MTAPETPVSEEVNIGFDRVLAENRGFRRRESAY